MLKGYKAYIMSGLVLVYGVTGFLTGHMTGTEAIGVIFSSGAIASLRAGMENAMHQWIVSQDEIVNSATNQISNGVQNN